MELLIGQVPRMDRVLEQILLSFHQTFPVSVLLMAFLVLVSLYTVHRSWREMRAGRFFESEEDAGPS